MDLNNIWYKCYSNIIPNVSAVLASHPLLTIKTNKQVIGGNPRGLYSGVNWYLVKSVPSSSLAFMALQNEHVKRLDPYLQGAVSKTFADLVTYPPNLWSAHKQVGSIPHGYFRGITPTLLGGVVFYSTFLQIHRGWLRDYPLPIRIICAATGASLLSQPLDWAKTRGQLKMPMNSVLSGWAWRLAYCNVRSLVAWGMYETFIYNADNNHIQDHDSDCNSHIRDLDDTVGNNHTQDHGNDGNNHIHQPSSRDIYNDKHRS